ncbi:hypothetical protein BGY98DRAFT_377037 [Russula aff. rugulosa BPL654]|nr:hypothetical protein BGY98DRAFT_377037 [Russula aff. rugulosa BPL654]
MLDDYISTVSFLAGFFVVVSLFISWYARGDPMFDAIPTIGFSDPILSYLSSLQFYYNGIPMLKEGYEKVICLMSLPRIEPMTLLHLDKTRSIQNRQLSGMDGSGRRI